MPIQHRVCAAVVATAALLAACDGTGSTSVTSPSSSPTVGSSESSRATSPAGEARREPVRLVWPVSKRVVWAWTARDSVRGSEHVLLTRDAGANWSDVTPTGLAGQTRSRRIAGLFVLDLDHAWLTVGGLASGTTQTLLSTADGGRHWTPLGRIPHPDCAIDFVSPTHGWCIRDRATMGQDAFVLYVSSDGGGTWERVNRHGSPPTTCDKDVRFTSASLGWAVTACIAGTPPIYRTRDGGEHWTASVVSPAAGDRSGGALFGDIPVLAGRHGAVPFYPSRPHAPLIYRSSDRGASWRPVRPPGPATPWRIDIRTPSSWILIHGDQLLSTDDAGHTWRRITMNHHFGEIAASYYDYAPVIDFPTPTTGWIVEFDSNRLWHTATAGRSWTRISIP